MRDPRWGDKEGRTACDARVRMEDDAKMKTTNGAFIRELTEIGEYTRTAKYRPGGAVSYSAGYREICTCYKGGGGPLRGRRLSIDGSAGNKGDCI